MCTLFKSVENIILPASVDSTKICVCVVASNAYGIFHFKIVVIEAFSYRSNNIDRFFRAFGTKTQQFISYFSSIIITKFQQ
jgi:hypothetical protein